MIRGFDITALYIEVIYFVSSNYVFFSYIIFIYDY